MNEQLDKEIYSLIEKMTLGKEIYEGAKRLFEKDIGTGRGIMYGFTKKDYETLEMEVEQLGLKKLLIGSIEMPSFYVTRGSVWHAKDGRGGSFKSRFSLEDFREALASDDLGKLLFDNVEAVDSFLLNLGVRTIPDDNTIISQWKGFQLIVDSFGYNLFEHQIRRLIKTPNGDKMPDVKSKTMREPTKNEFKFFQAILSKNLQKVKEIFL